MVSAQQTIINSCDKAIYVSLEPNPECYELEKGDKMTVIYELPASGDGLTVSMINSRELVMWPVVFHPEPVVLINGDSSEGRSWKFKHKYPE